MNLRTKEGFKVGYSSGATHTPLEYMLHLNPKTAVFPRGFKVLLMETCPRAWAELIKGGIVANHRFRDILEKNFNHIQDNKQW